MEFLEIKEVILKLLSGKIPDDDINSIVEDIAVRWHNDVTEMYQEGFDKGFEHGFGTI